MSAAAGAGLAFGALQDRVLGEGTVGGLGNFSMGHGKHAHGVQQPGQCPKFSMDAGLQLQALIRPSGGHGPASPFPTLAHFRQPFRLRRAKPTPAHTAGIGEVLPSRNGPAEWHYRGMTKYLISFPGKGQAMNLTDEEFPIVVAESHAVIEEAKAAGVYVFGGGIAEDVAPVLVQADGSAGTDIYPGSDITGGITVLEVPTRAEAEQWAAKIAAACRCAQELREFMYDPAS